MICKGKEKYLFAMSKRAGSVSRPLPPPSSHGVGGGEGGGVAGRVLLGDSEWGSGVLWKVNTASWNRAYFWQVKSAG
jgi:hypothetical protein